VFHKQVSAKLPFLRVSLHWNNRDDMRVLDLFSGIGGFSLGLERTKGFETVAFCEVGEFQRQVLQKHWPDVRVYPDIKTLPPLEADVICGGFPCQPFSTASHGVRVAEDLWPYMLASIDAVRPKYIIAENVAEKPIRKAETDMKDLGYATTAIRIGAHDAGADHKRNRWWLCAYPNQNGKLHSAIHAEASVLPQLCEGLWSSQNFAAALRVSDGVSDRVDRVRALGNAVLPQIPEMFGRAILATM
jgi:DNA (cytosine-5)-methyltransferase 1